MTKNERNLLKVLKAEEKHAREMTELFLKENDTKRADQYNSEAMTLWHVITMIELKVLKNFAKIHDVELE